MEMLEDVGLGRNFGADGVLLQRDFYVIFLSISAAKNTVPCLQTVYQANAAHMNFGKYTLYSCYGITANCNAFPVAFGIIFGNEDKKRSCLGSLQQRDIHASIMLGSPSSLINRRDQSWQWLMFYLML
jgi:hypothetical protein